MYNIKLNDTMFPSLLLVFIVVVVVVFYFGF